MLTWKEKRNLDEKNLTGKVFCRSFFFAIEREKDFSESTVSAAFYGG